MWKNEARAAIAALDAHRAALRPDPQTVTSAEGLRKIPVGTVVLSAEGTIACKAGLGADTVGVVFGDERPFPWHTLALPVRILWPTPAPRATVTKEQVADLADYFRTSEDSMRDALKNVGLLTGNGGA
jgi:hypothetical protein